MAIQTQGFQFQNLARYTPVDPTLVGVDFSKIGSGIADAMKIGGALQQYQMRKQAMEEEAATRETRIRQANTMSDLAAAEAAARRLNVQQYEDAKRAAAEAEKARALAAIPTFGPESTAKIRAAELAARQSAVALPLVDIEARVREGKLFQELGVMPLEEQARKLAVMRQIGAGERAIGQNLDAIREGMGLQSEMLALTRGSLQLDSEQAKAANERADALYKNAQTMAALAGKTKDPLPLYKEFNDQIAALEKQLVPNSSGKGITLFDYERDFGPPGSTATKTNWRGKPLERDPILDRRLQELYELRQVRDVLKQRVNAEVLGESMGGGQTSVPRIGGLDTAGFQFDRSGLLANVAAQLQQNLGGMSSAQPAAGGAAQPFQLPAGITEAGVSIPTSGVTLAPGLGEVAAPVSAPAATVRLRDGKVEMITPDGAAPAPATTKPAAEGESLTQYLPEVGSAAALLPKLLSKENINNFREFVFNQSRRSKALSRILGPRVAEFGGQVVQGATRALPVAGAINLGDLLIGRILSEKGNRMRASEAIRTALNIENAAAFPSGEEDMYRQQRILGLLDQKKYILNSDILTKEEKIDKARELDSRIKAIKEEVVNSTGTTKANPYGIPTAKNYGSRPSEPLFTTTEPTEGRGASVVFSGVPDVIVPSMTDQSPNANISNSEVPVPMDAITRYFNQQPVSLTESRSGLLGNIPQYIAPETPEDMGVPVGAYEYLRDELRVKQEKDLKKRKELKEEFDRKVKNNEYDLPVDPKARRALLDYLSPSIPSDIFRRTDNVERKSRIEQLLGK
jgi:hypothetical protein